jgi:Eco29kI restriction endonuclease
LKEETPYNPLDKRNLGISVETALIRSSVHPLPPKEKFTGAGIYAIYYTGDFKSYKKISERNRNKRFELPIYVGKAVPKGARKGGFGLGISPGTVLYSRLRQHSNSIKEVDLNLSDFFCRYLVVDDIWIPLGESLLIEMYSPIWNKVIDGFGIHAPGKGRENQQKSLWDMVHPGRKLTEKLPDNLKTKDQILRNLKHFLEGKKAEVIDTLKAIEEDAIDED